MSDLLKRLESKDAAVAKTAQAQMKKLAAEHGVSVAEEYTKQALDAATIKKEQAVEKSGRRSKVSFAGVFGPPKDEVRKGGGQYSPDDPGTADRTTGSTVGPDHNIGTVGGIHDDEEARPATPSLGPAPSGGDYGDDDSGHREPKMKGARSVAGTLARHSLSKDVSFTDVVMGPKTVSYDIGELGHDVEGADDGEDALGRSYDGETNVRDEFYASMGGLGSIPAAGAVETHVGYGGSGDFKPLANRDEPYIGGQQKPYVEGLGDAIRSNPDATEIGTPGNVTVRVGDNWLLVNADPNIAPAAMPKFPDSKATTLKGAVRKEARRSMFRNIIGDDPTAITQPK